jgi:hypothetical protein
MHFPFGITKARVINENCIFSVLDNVCATALLARLDFPMSSLCDVYVELDVKLEIRLKD